jgi:hypothetical protein
MTDQKTIHEPHFQYMLTSGSKHRECNNYYYEAGREESRSSSILTGTTEYRTRKEQQQQQQLEQEQEQQIISGMKLSAQILKALDSLEALVIFQRVANSGINGIDNTSLGQSALPLMTRKQFYTRMGALKQVGLISRTSGKYRLTSLRLVVRSSLSIINKGIKFKWPLMALDAAGAGAGAKQQQQRQRHHNLEPQIKDILIDNLVTDETIKKILMIE